jgi:hypothetical protein
MPSLDEKPGDHDVRAAPRRPAVPVSACTCVARDDTGAVFSHADSGPPDPRMSGNRAYTTMPPAATPTTLSRLAFGAGACGARPATD